MTTEAGYAGEHTVIDVSELYPTIFTRTVPISAEARGGLAKSNGRKQTWRNKND
jgi:hypothetical protein